MEKSSLNKNYTFAILDVFITVIALSLASLLHYDLGITSSDINQLYQWAIVLISCQFIIFYFTGLYSRIWQYTGLVDLFTLIRSSVLSGLVSFTILSFGKDNFALALFFIFGILNLILVASSRLSVRVFYTYISNINTTNFPKYKSKYL